MPLRPGMSVRKHTRSGSKPPRMGHIHSPPSMRCGLPARSRSRVRRRQQVHKGSTASEKNRPVRRQQVHHGQKRPTRSSIGVRRLLSPRCMAVRASSKRCSTGWCRTAAGWLRLSGSAGWASPAWRSPSPSASCPNLMWCFSVRCKTGRRSRRGSTRPSAPSPTSVRPHLTRYPTRSRCSFSCFARGVAC